MKGIHTLHYSLYVKCLISQGTPPYSGEKYPCCNGTTCEYNSFAGVLCLKGDGQCQEDSHCEYPLLPVTVSSKTSSLHQSHTLLLLSHFFLPSHFPLITISLLLDPYTSHNHLSVPRSSASVNPLAIISLLPDPLPLS